MMVCGNPPDLARGWRAIGSVNADGSLWHIHVQPRAGDWMPVKVAADGFVQKKANFWLAYNRSEDRLARGSEAMLLRERRPALADAVMSFLRAHDCAV